MFRLMLFQRSYDQDDVAASKHPPHHLHQNDSGEEKGEVHPAFTDTVQLIRS